MSRLHRIIARSGAILFDTCSSSRVLPYKKLNNPTCIHRARFDMQGVLTCTEIQTIFFIKGFKCPSNHWILLNFTEKKNSFFLNFHEKWPKMNKWRFWLWFFIFFGWNINKSASQWSFQVCPEVRKIIMKKKTFRFQQRKLYMNEIEEKRIDLAVFRNMNQY